MAEDTRQSTVDTTKHMEHSRRSRRCRVYFIGLARAHVSVFSLFHFVQCAALSSLTFFHLILFWRRPFIGTRQNQLLNNCERVCEIRRLTRNWSSSSPSSSSLLLPLVQTVELLRYDQRRSKLWNDSLLCMPIPPSSPHHHLVRNSVYHSSIVYEFLFYCNFCCVVLLRYSLVCPAWRRWTREKASQPANQPETVT